MSLTRVSCLAHRRTVIPLLSHRKASSSTHENDHFSKEGFGGPFWRNTVLFSLLTVGAYKYAPEPTDDAYLTRWIALYTTPRDLWIDLAARHTAMSIDNSETVLLLSDAQKPVVHRYRYPQSFEQVSPFLTPVGMDVDTSKFVVKGDKD